MGAGSTVGKQTQLLVLDPVLHVTPGTVLLVVELEAVIVTGADDEQGIVVESYDCVCRLA